MTGDKAILRSTIAAVSLVALVAASVSYRHALQVVEAHGETGWLAYVYPLTVDGLIYAASMVLLNDARRGHKHGHWLAYGALGLGIIATLAANVAAGLAAGPVGGLIASWPAPALVVSYELLMLVIRRSAMPVAAPDPAEPVKSTPRPRARSTSKSAGRGIEAAAEAARHAVAEGQSIPSARAWPGSTTSAGTGPPRSARRSWPSPTGTREEVSRDDG
jgi:hypothetical protein